MEPGPAQPGFQLPASPVSTNGRASAHTETIRFADAVCRAELVRTGGGQVLSGLPVPRYEAGESRMDHGR